MTYCRIRSRGRGLVGVKLQVVRAPMVVVELDFDGFIHRTGPRFHGRSPAAQANRAETRPFTPQRSVMLSTILLLMFDLFYNGAVY